MSNSIEVMVRTPGGIEDDDLVPLREGLPDGCQLRHEVGQVQIVDLAEAVASVNEQDSERQLSFGLDPATVLAVLIAPLPVVFLKTLAEKAAEDFWLGIKRLLTKVASRRKAIPLASIQLQFHLETYFGVPVAMAITYLNAVHVSEATWIEMIETCRRGAAEHLSAARALVKSTVSDGDADRAVSGVVIHALIDGGMPPVWQIAMLAQ